MWPVKLCLKFSAFRRPFEGQNIVAHHELGNLAATAACLEELAIAAHAPIAERLPARRGAGHVLHPDQVALDQQGAVGTGAGWRVPYPVSPAVEDVAAVEQIAAHGAFGVAVVLDAVVADVAQPAVAQHEAVRAIGYEAVVMVVDAHGLDHRTFAVDRDGIAAAVPLGLAPGCVDRLGAEDDPAGEANGHLLRRRVVLCAPEIAPPSAVDIGAPVEAELH